MAEITLNLEDAHRVLANPDSDANSRVISALAIAYLEVSKHAIDTDMNTIAISKKLAHMCAVEIYEAAEAI